ncbi:LacI family DNA-binding transcriptional regulator [Microbacterium fluvii]|uniref:LacI family DNA-binding transcriptional regulator n=1 Tax=Microbacterium fluvii TaxID=415215 RepID=A0ABW2HF63_9MICO|nr:LacI family DNA-binding transcriptional regulator [Microbacterium fluvii]MCU4672783.1 LacI family transcriptional regulator [Microbacterium fluvii]
MSPRPHGVTSIDVAKAAGVSQTTVSRVLNGHPAVSDKMRERVLTAIDGLRYRPNLSARSLVTSRTNTIGVVLGELTNSYYAELLNTISAELAAAGYRTLIVSDRAGGAENLASTLWETSVDGVIVTTTLLPSEEMSPILSLGVPMVTMGPDFEARVDSLTPDNSEGGRLAARHLLDLGHRRIGVVTGPLDAGSVRDRHRGFLEEFAARDVRLDDDLVQGADLTYERAYTAAHALLSLPDRPTALFCHNDLMAFAALNAATGLGIEVPGEVSILGFDDVRASAWESFRLTTVRQPIRDMALGAVRMLLDRFADPDGDAVHVVLPCELVERATTRALAAG